MLEALLFFLIVVAGTGGELCVSRAMKVVGEVKDFRPLSIARVIFRAMRVGWLWAGIGMMALGFFSLLGALSFLNVSFVVPGHCAELRGRSMRGSVLSGRACKPAALGWPLPGHRWGHPGVSGQSMSALPGVRSTKSIAFREIVLLAIDSFRLNQIRFALTALGMVIGTASLILVVTIGLSGRKYVLTSIQNIGTNLVWAEYAGLSDASVASVRDYLTVDDMRAVEQQVPGIQAASPVLNLHQFFTSGGGKERDVLILGVDPAYADIRRLYLVAGRFFDEQDSLTHSHAALVTEKFAAIQFGNPGEAIGKTLAISGVPFTIIGVFRERVETFGQSEIVDETVLIPYTVGRYFTGTDAVNQIYFSMTDSNNVPAATEAI